MIENLSLLLDRAIPEHIRESDPGFVDFIKAYLAFQDDTRSPFHVIQKLLLDSDIDSSFVEFIDYYHSTHAKYLPEKTLADKLKIVKHLREIYAVKGTEESYRWFFRTYYNEEITIYYPRNDILRVSDGKWVTPYFLTILNTDNSIPAINQLSPLKTNSILGLTSGTTGIVDSYFAIMLSVKSIKLSMANSIGNFVAGEIIRYTDINGINHDFTITSADISPGFWSNTDGFLSSNKKIQDARYYQDFSYEITSNHGFNEYKEQIKRSIHPAGTVMFGKIRNLTEVSVANAVAGIDYRTVAHNKQTTYNWLKAVPYSTISNVSTVAKSINVNYGYLDSNKFNYGTQNTLLTIQGTPSDLSISDFNGTTNRNRVWDYAREAYHVSI
ncbi:MAG: hypothetical protein R8M45_03895 [Ghiorsea sp.]